MAAVPQSSYGERLPPPRTEVGALGWVRQNLFNSKFNAVLTVVSAAVIVLALVYGLRWIISGADWTVIGVLGGRMVIGQYNTEAACPGQNCFWRPQVSLLLVSAMLGMAWAMAGGGVAKRLAIGVVIIIALFALLPYSFERMGMDVRLLLAANIPAMLAGWAIAHYTRMSGRGIAIYGVAAFIVTLVLLRGIPGVQGLQPVLVIYWGGITLNILLAVVGISLSLPIGIALALGRRSNLNIPLGDALIYWFERLFMTRLFLPLTILLAAIFPGSVGSRCIASAQWIIRLVFNLNFVKLFCVVFIEVYRGVPLITLLFMSQVLVPLAFPEDFPVNSLLRAGIIITLFSSAYMAENIRGGLQALLPGQAEAARALGLSARQTTLLISLPQAIRNVIPAIVGQFIALFKDTSLVYIIGMLDVVEISRAFIQGNAQYLGNAKELFIFLALVFWVFTFTMSYVSQKVEEHLGVGGSPQADDSPSPQPSPSREQGGKREGPEIWSDEITNGGPSGEPDHHLRVMSTSGSETSMCCGVLSTSVERSEKVVVVGPSGSGKSTFIRTINRLEEHQRGDIVVDGMPMTQDVRNIDAIRREVGMVFQQFNLFPHLSVYAEYHPRAHQGAQVAPQRGRGGGHGAAGAGGNPGAGRAKYPGELSGGQQQRVAIARALAMQPKIMLFDEPTSALDPEMIREVLDVMRELAESGMTMIIVTHEIGFATEVADRIMMFDEGVIIEDAPPSQFFNNPQQERTQAFLSQILS